jgi:phosphoribosyl 1,2-cyclic phosphate phosphodiesterase
VKLIMLGSGTSTGVPRIGGPDGRGDWGDCDPAEPRNRRSRVSIVVESSAGARILVDTSPDLRSQLLANGIDQLDAVFWTHDHADHTHGIDDLRPMRYGRGGPMPGFGHEETVRRLRNRFGYVFAGQHGYATICTIERWCQMEHGPAQSTAYLFEADGKSIGYATDFSAINREMVELFSGADVLVIDCLRRDPHPTHAHLGMALELAEAARANLAVLTHMDRSMDYATLSAELPPHVVVGYDGLVVEA